MVRLLIYATAGAFKRLANVWLDDGSLTAERTYTFPDKSGQFTLDFIDVIVTTNTTVGFKRIA